MTQSAVKSHNGPADRFAIGRRGLPLNPSRSAPGMSSTPSAQSHIRGYRPAARNPSFGGLPKSDYAHAAAARPAKAGVSPKAARLAGTGLCLFGCLPAHRAEGPQPPHELGGGGGVRLRLGHAPGEHLLAAPEQALGTLPPVHPHLERDAAALGHQLRLVARLGVAPGPSTASLLTSALPAPPIPPRRTESALDLCFGARPK